MLEEIIKQKTSADHLFYVSLKYTKTCDVILNLIARWRSMIGLCIDALLKKAKKEKKIKEIPTAPRPKINLLRELYKKNKIMQETLDLFEFFRRIDGLEKIKEHEFRKNVTLRVIDKGKMININMETLESYAELLEKFIREIKQELSS